MNKELYYTPRTDKQRISELQRKVMKLETQNSELLNTIDESYSQLSRLETKNTNLHLRHKEYKTSVREMLENKELTDVSFEDDGRIVPEYKGYSQSLGDDEFNPNSREQTPMFMLDTLKECHDVIDDSTESGEGLKKDLRKVIQFLTP